MTDMVWHRPPTRQSCQSTSRVVLAVSALMLGACVLSVLRRDSGTALSGSAEFTPRDQNLTGVDAGRAIVTWPLKADDSPVGIIMAGSVLGNQAVLEKALGEDGTLSDWKAQSKKAATASVQEAMEEIIDDDPFENRPGQRAVDEHELRDVVAKAQRLAYPAGDIASGGEETGQAHHVANAEAQAAAVMAANEAAVVDTYDMPHPPEAANDKPFAHKSGRAGIFRTQKRVVSGSRNWAGVVAPRVKGPKIKVLSITHKVKGPSQHELMKRFVKPHSARVAGGLKRELRAPSVRLQSLLQQGDDAADRADAERAALGIRNLFDVFVKAQDAARSKKAVQKPTVAPGTELTSAAPIAKESRGTKSAVKNPLFDAFEQAYASKNAFFRYTHLTSLGDAKKRKKFDPTLEPKEVQDMIREKQMLCCVRNGKDLDNMQYPYFYDYPEQLYCIPGYRKEGTDCVACDPGTTCPKSVDFIVPCAAGRDSPEASGTDQCTQCAAGYHKAQATLYSPCVPCPPDHYCPGKPASLIIPCPKGMNTAGTGMATSFDHCKCPAGSILQPPPDAGEPGGDSFEPCQQCEANSFCPDVKTQVPCATLGQHLVSPSGSSNETDCVCEALYEMVEGMCVPACIAEKGLSMCRTCT